jgi:hypothetical protein
VGAVDNGGALVAPFIDPQGGERRAVRGRKVVTVQLEWHWLWEMETGKGMQWGVTVFEGEEGEEARRLHNVVGG